ncbi:hypothetical protein Tco_1240308, partial [Tanacetum coccineum]
PRWGFTTQVLNDDPFSQFSPKKQINNVESVKTSIEEPPDLELKDLPSHLEYAFLEKDNKLPVIISKDLKDDEKVKLIEVLKAHKSALAWKISDIKGIDPKFCTHKILMEDDFKPVVQMQRRVNPKIHEVIKKEVIKLLDAGLIYPISDSPWVSPVHCVPKKGGMTVVQNDDNELIPTRLVTGWRVCIDYRKLNDATRKDHFPLPFMDQMLERYGYSSVGRFDVFFRDQLLVFQQHQDESLYDSWTRFKDIILKVPNHGVSIWTLIEIFLKHLDSLSHHIINLTAEGDLRKFSDIGAWVQVPRCMAWLDYDEHVDSPSMMDNEVGVTSPESTTQTLPSFEEYTPPVTYPKEVKKTLGTSIEVEPLNETKLEEVGLNCNHNTPFSSREIPNFDEPETQPQPLLSFPSLDISLGEGIGLEPPIKPHSLDSFRMKVVDNLATYIPPLPHMASSYPKDMYCDYHPCLDDPKRHYGFKPGLLEQSGSLDVDFSNMEEIEDNFLGEGLSLPMKPKDLEKGKIKETYHLEHIIQLPLFQYKDLSYHNGVYRDYHPHLNSSVGEPSPLSVK